MSDRNRSPEYVVRVDKDANDLIVAEAFIQKRNEKTVVSEMIKKMVSQRAYALCPSVPARADIQTELPKDFFTARDLVANRLGPNFTIPKDLASKNVRPLTRTEIQKFKKTGIRDLGPEFQDRANYIMGAPEDEFYLVMGGAKPQSKTPRHPFIMTKTPAIALPQHEADLLKKVNNTVPIKDDPASIAYQTLGEEV